MKWVTKRGEQLIDKQTECQAIKFYISTLFQVPSNVERIAENVFRLDLFKWIYFWKCNDIFVNNFQCKNFRCIMTKSYEFIRWVWCKQNEKMFDMIQKVNIFQSSKLGLLIDRSYCQKWGGNTFLFWMKFPLKHFPLKDIKVDG